MVTLKNNTLQFNEIKPYLEQLSKELSETLKSNNYFAKGISVMAVLDDLNIISKSKLADKPINSEKDIYKIAEPLLLDLIKKSPRMFRRLALRAYDLISYEGIESLERFV